MGQQPQQPIELQQRYWSEWNASNREVRLSDISLDQRNVVVEWLRERNQTDMNIIEVGCGAGWLCPSLVQFGQVTATDFAEAVLERAKQRNPDVDFVAGDFMALDFPEAAYDVVVTLEVLSHVADQDAFVAKLARLLKPGGILILATQNKPVLEKYNDVPATEPGQLRLWVDRVELEHLLGAQLDVREVRSITPVASKGPLRLVAGRHGKRVLRALTGRAAENALGRAGLGWTLIARAEKPA